MKMQRNLSKCVFYVKIQGSQKGFIKGRRESCALIGWHGSSDSFVGLNSEKGGVKKSKEFWVLLAQWQAKSTHTWSRCTIKIQGRRNKQLQRRTGKRLFFFSCFPDYLLYFPHLCSRLLVSLTPRVILWRGSLWQPQIEVMLVFFWVTYLQL